MIIPSPLYFSIWLVLTIGLVFGKKWYMLISLVLIIGFTMSFKPYGVNVDMPDSFFNDVIDFFINSWKGLLGLIFIGCFILSLRNNR